MKTLFFVLGLTLTTLACSSDPAPTAAATVQGTYVASRLLYDAPGRLDDYDYELPLVISGRTLAATLRLKAGSSDTKVQPILVLTLTGAADRQTDFAEVDLRPNGNGYDLFTGAVKAGTADGTSCSFDVMVSGTRYLVVGKK